MRIRCRATVVLALLTLTACTHSIHQVQVSDYAPYASYNKSDIVKGYAEQFVIMSFTMQSDYVDQARLQLMKACPGGTVTGITTQISTSHGFFSWTNKATMQGLCVKVSRS